MGEVVPARTSLSDPTSPIPSHCAPIVATSTLRVNIHAIFVLLHHTKYMGSIDTANRSVQEKQLCLLHQY